MFREAHRVLVPGGRMRLFTPDVEHVVRLYTACDEQTRLQMEKSSRTGCDVHHPVDLLCATFQDCGHHAGNLWDFRSLSAELESAGLKNIRRCVAGQSDDPDLRSLESRPEFVLIVEGKRILEIEWARLRQGIG